MADGDDPAVRGLRSAVRIFGADEFEMRAQFSGVMAGGLDGAGKIFADAPEIFPGQGADFRRRFFLAEAQRQIRSATRRCARVKLKGQPAHRAAKPGDPGSGSAWINATRARASQ